MGRKLNVVVMSDYFWPHIGGSEEWNRQVSLELARRGHRVTVLTYMMPSHTRDEVLEGLIYVKRMGPWTIRGIQPYFKRVLIQGYGIFDYVRRKLGEIDVMQVSQTYPLLPAWVAKKTLSKRKKVPIVATWHDVYGIANSFRYRGWRGLIRGPLESFVLKLPYDAVTAVSESTKRKLVEAGLEEEEIRVVYNGVDLKLADRVYSEKSVNPRVCYVGRLVSHKRVQDLIAAFSKVGSRYPEAELYIVGDGTERRRLEETARRLGVSRVIFTGFVSEKRKVEILKSSWVLVQPSILEGFGITLIEAMACRLPVIAADVGGPREVVDPSCGFFYSPCDVNELVDRIEALLANAKLMENMGNSGRRKVEEKFTWQRTVDRLESVYYEFVS